MMSWFNKFFKQGNTSDSQPLNSPKRQDFTGVLQAVVEETVMAIAQWVIVLVNQSLEKKSVVPEQTAPAPISPVEELVPKVTTLIEQLYDRAESLIALENRIGIVEQSIHSNSPEATQELSDKIEQLIEQNQQSNQEIESLKSRLVHLEKVLEKYRVLPKIIQQDRQTIATLKDRIAVLESLQVSHKTLVETLPSTLEFVPLHEWSNSTNSSKDHPTH